MPLTVQGVDSQEVIMNCVYEPVDVCAHVCLSVKVSTRKDSLWDYFFPSELYKQLSRHKFTLDSSFSPLNKHWTRWAICAPACRTKWFPILGCQGICFSASANGSNYTTDTYNSVLSLLTHHLNLYRSILCLNSVSHNATTRDAVSLLANLNVSHNFDCRASIFKIGAVTSQNNEWWGAVSSMGIKSDCVHGEWSDE